MRRRVVGCAAALGIAVACNATPSPLACPGQAVGVFNFTGTADDASGWCAFKGNPSSISFTGTLAWGSDTEAILCLDRPDADPLRGPRDGDHFSVKAPATTAYAATCACTTTVTESLDGVVARGAAGAATGITGTLVDDVTAQTAGATCEKPPPSAACGVPCTMRWSITASR